MASKEEYDQQKAMRIREMERKAKTQAVKKILPWIIGGVVLVVLLVVGVTQGWFKRSSQNGEVKDTKPITLKIQEFPDQGRDHISVGAQHPSYNSNPPTSGWHYAQWADIKIYDKEVPDENLVHNLEHGEIWIAYKPGIDGAVIEQLKEVARKNSTWVVMAPREANDADIAVVAWGRLDKFSASEFSKERVQEFINQYRDKGPEKVRH